MKAIVYQGAENVKAVEKESPIPKDGETLIQVAHAGICGTDLNIFAGTHPRAQAPLVMGHEFSGVIASKHPKLPEGTPVTVNPLLTCGTCRPCLNGESHVCEQLKLIGIDTDGGMAEYVSVPTESIIPLREGTSLAAGALVEPIAVAVHAVRQGKYKPGDQVVVFGAGTIGLCTAMVLRKFGADDVTVVETNGERIKKAEELGFQTVNPMQDSMKYNADIVFDCAGHPAVIQQVTDVVKVRGHIVIVAAYKKPAEVNLLQGMFKELSFQFVRVYTAKDFELAVGIIHSDPDFEKIITHVLEPEEAQGGFQLLTTPSDAVKVMFQFN
ncbi:zinc-dependent alcohol dehydrogenase [Domibacillus indicus]|uniref:zinc-dependent alcohol dehydrogenase n=1 Tax=Domibacillus indicus TaxID=1437523 RepID=UPI0006181F99|nr:alcohol dehydrogenase catalytic domain-containing protein [Domibacillus indicus]